MSNSVPHSKTPGLLHLYWYTPMVNLYSAVKRII